MATKKDNVKEEPKKYTCSTCGRTVGEREYYGTFSDKYASCGGKLPHCKNCIKESFEKSFLDTSDVKKSILSTCMRFDVPYNETMIVEYNDTSIEIVDAIKIWYEYIKMANSIHKKIGGKKSCDYEALASMILDSESQDDEDEKLYLTESDLGIEVGREEIEFFGNGFRKKDYIFLTKSFLSLVQSFDVPNSTVANVYKDLCFLDLKIDEAKHNGSDIKTILSLQKGRRDLFKDANVTLYEKSGDEKIDGIGKMIQRMEMTMPASQEVLKDWKNDNILEDLSYIIAGHILMADGYENKIVDKYREVLAEYSIDINNLWGVEEDDS